MTRSQPSRLQRWLITKTLAQARWHLKHGRFGAVNAALEGLQALVPPDGLQDPDILLAWGQGACVAAALGLHSGAADMVLPCVASACSVMEQLALPPRAVTLGDEIIGIPFAVRHRASNPRPFHEELSQRALAVIDHAAAGDRRDDPFRDLLALSDAMAENTDLPRRVLLSVVLIAIGHEASEHGDVGRAVLAYGACLRWVERIDESVGFLMAMEVFQPLAFQLQRGGDWSGMQEVIGRLSAYLAPRPELDEAGRAEMIQMVRRVQDMALAAQHGDIGARTRAAQDLAEMLSPQDMAMVPVTVRKFMDFFTSAGADLPSFELSDVMRGHPLTGYPGLVEADKMLDRNDFRGVLQLLAVAIPAADAHYNHWAAWRSALMLARIFAAGGSPLLSAVFGKLTVRIVEHGRLEAVSRGLPYLSILTDKGAEDAYRSVAGWLVEHGRLGEALRIELLLEQIEDKIPVPRADDVAAAVDARCPFADVERIAMGVLAAIAANPVNQVVSRNPLTRFRQKLQVARLRNLHGDLTKHTRFASPAAADWAELAALPQGTAALGIFDTGSDVFVSFFQAGQSRRMQLAVDSAGLRQSVYAAMRALRTGSDDAIARCRALYDLVLAPIAAWLDTSISTLVVQASGALRHVPFGVLFDGSRFLIERCAIVTHPGSQMVVADRGLRLPIRGLSVAISETPGQASLRQARAESENLMQLVQAHAAGSIRPVFDGDATAETLDALLAERPNLLHLACHFEADPSDAGRSSFLLADGTRYPLARLAGLDLSSIDLCLLSACDTRATGDIEGASGITALDSLLLRQGVGAIVSTAWPVQDDNAHRFMTAFTTAMIRDGHNQAEALRSAVMALARRAGAFDNPHRWGAFALSGGWNGVAA